MSNVVNCALISFALIRLVPIFSANPIYLTKLISTLILILKRSGYCGTLEFLAVQGCWISPLAMDKSTNIEDLECLKEDPSLKKSVSNKHLDLLRPTAQYLNVFKGQIKNIAGQGKAKYSVIKDVEVYQPGIYDKPLPCFGCGMGWFSFLLGIMCPALWFYGAYLYLGSYYHKDPRERAGLAASAIAALGCCVVILIIVLIRLF